MRIALSLPVLFQRGDNQLNALHKPFQLKHFMVIDLLPCKAQSRVSQILPVLLVSIPTPSPTLVPPT